ncbi:MAG: PilZ domain-containing protein [Agarilytica sp.]
MEEEYFSADRLLELNIGSVVQAAREDNDQHYSVVLVGADYGKSVITTLPNAQHIADGETYDSIFAKGTVLEMKTIHEGRIVAYESQVLSLFDNRLLIGSFPEMIETRRLRRDIRFPCVLPVDIKQADGVAFGVITNISAGGCQINVPKNNEYDFIEKSLQDGKYIDLEVLFPVEEDTIVISAYVKSSVCQIDGACKVGLSFQGEYECVRRYLESLQLDSVAPFFY